MSLYTFGSQIILGEAAAGVMIDAAQIGVGFTRFRRGFAPRNRAVMAEWLDDLMIWIELAHHYAERQYWPQNDTACQKFGGCRYRGICSNNPSVRDNFIRSDFVQNRWRPLDVR